MFSTFTGLCTFCRSIFSAHQSLVVLSLYILGIVVALLVSTLLNKLILKDNQSVLLWSYRHTVFHHLKHFGAVLGKKQKVLSKAGTFIFGGSVVIWTLTYIGPHGVNVPINQSFMHMIGQGFANLIAPLGFGSWQAGATLIPGFLAKEVIISSMAILYSSSESGLTQVIQQQFTPLSAYAFMILFYFTFLVSQQSQRFVKRQVLEMDIISGCLSNSNSIYINVYILSS